MKGRVRKLYFKKTKFYRLRKTAADGRFQTEDIVGGVDERTALFEAERLKELGLNVDIFNSEY